MIIIAVIIIIIVITIVINVDDDEEEEEILYIYMCCNVVSYVFPPNALLDALMRHRQGCIARSQPRNSQTLHRAVREP